MNCEKCGAPLPEDTLICPVCGAENAPAPVPTPETVEEAAPEEATSELVETAPSQEASDPPSESAEVPTQQPQPPKAEPVDEKPTEPQGQVNIVTPIYARAREEYFKPGIAPDAPAQPKRKEEVPGAVDYFLMQLIAGLPLIGLIVSIVWATDHTVTHRKNFALGNLLYRLVRLVVWLLIAAIVLSLLNLLISQLTYNPYLDSFGSFIY